MIVSKINIFNGVIFETFSNGSVCNTFEDLSIDLHLYNFDLKELFFFEKLSKKIHDPRSVEIFKKKKSKFFFYDFVV